MTVPAPSNSTEYVIAIVFIAIVAVFGLWVKFGGSKKNAGSDSGVQEKLAVDKQRIDSLERNVNQLWAAVDQIRNVQAENVSNLREMIGEIKGILRGLE